jgi:hypothetical protein
MFVKGAAVISEFETVDGLRIEIAVRVTDVHGSADLVAGNVIDMVQDYVAEYDEAFWKAAEENARS